MFVKSQEKLCNKNFKCKTKSTKIVQNVVNFAQGVCFEESNCQKTKYQQV